MKNAKNKIGFIALVFCFMCLFISNGSAQTSRYNPNIAEINTEYYVVESVTPYFSTNSEDLTPIIMTYVDTEGLVTVCSVPVISIYKDVYMYEFSKDLVLQKTIKLPRELSKFGAFTKDSEGNYYVFSAEDAEEGAFNQNNMALVKYDNQGNKQKVYYLNAYADNSSNGVKEPFRFGSCRMEISGTMLCVYFARVKFKSDDGFNHQASYGFIVDKDTFKRMDIGQVLQGTRMPYASHSFNQFILSIENGFIFADQGDAFPRAFNFSKFENGKDTKELRSFEFKKGKTYQNTFAQLGGLAKTSTGYIFAGTYEKNNDVSGEHNDSRNVFILTFDDTLSACSAPVWITNYKDKKQNALSPKIVALDKERYLLMWELWEFTGANASDHTIYITIIDKNGKIVKPIKKIADYRIRLNKNDTLRYCSKTGNVYWAVGSGSNKITVYAFNPDNSIKIKK